MEQSKQTRLQDQRKMSTQISTSCALFCTQFVVDFAAGNEWSNLDAESSLETVGRMCEGCLVFWSGVNHKSKAATNSSTCGRSGKIQLGNNMLVNFGREFPRLSQRWVD